MKWSTNTSERVVVDKQETLKQRSAYVDLTDSAQPGLEFGNETLFVNAAICDASYRPSNAPWVVDLALPVSKPSSIGIPGSDEEALEDSASQLHQST